MNAVTRVGTVHPDDGSPAVTPQALVIGESGAGKTHFILQLVGRLNRQQGRFRMRGAAPDLSALEEATRQLNRGLAAAHTPSGEYREIALPLTDGTSGAVVDVIWPDYAGEQVTRIVAEREVSPEWRARAQAADTWLLFVRPQRLQSADDALSRPIGRVQVRGGSGGRGQATAAAESQTAGLSNQGTSADMYSAVGAAASSWLDQARVVELLQLLLAARRASARRPLRDPRLVVLLTCWDELPDMAPPATASRTDADVGRAPPSAIPAPDAEPVQTGESPRATTQPGDYFRQRAPLLARFVDATWAAEAFAVFGVSSLSRPLRADQPDQDFLDFGPEAFGYVVLPNGAVTPDLTTPLGIVRPPLSDAGRAGAPAAGAPTEHRLRAGSPDTTPHAALGAARDAGAHGPA